MKLEQYKRPTTQYETEEWTAETCSHGHHLQLHKVVASKRPLKAPAMKGNISRSSQKKKRNEEEEISLDT